MDNRVVIEKLKTGILTNMTTIQPQKIGSHLNDALQIISDAAQLYPDSRNLARHHAELLAQCGRGGEALGACEAFLVKFGVDDDLLDLALQLRQQTGVFDRLEKAGKHSISLCMIVKNEEKYLPACLASLKPVVDEMIVVDTGSTDCTMDVATVFGAKVLTFPWNGNFSDARNCSLAAANAIWSLVMDADEVLSSQDHDKVRRAVDSESANKSAWSVLTRNYTTKINAQGWTPNDHLFPLEERADGWHPSWKVRLFTNDSRIRFKGDVHEMLEYDLRQLGIRITPATFVVHHYGGLQEEKNKAKMLQYFELGKKKLGEHPDDTTALLELAMQAGELGFYEEGLALWNRLLELEPQNIEALFNKGYVLIGLQRYHEAGSVSEMVLALDPNHKEAGFNYGTCELYEGDPLRAALRLEPLLGKFQNYPPLLAIMTLLQALSGRRETAAEIYAQLKSLNYAIEEYTQARSQVLLRLGKEQQAEKLLSECAAIGMKLPCPGIVATKV